MSYAKARCSSGALLPEELELLQEIFDRIQNEIWFARSPDNQERFAQYILRIYRCGFISSEMLPTFCEKAARSYFGVARNFEPEASPPKFELRLAR